MLRCAQNILTCASLLLLGHCGNAARTSTKSENCAPLAQGDRNRDKAAHRPTPLHHTTQKAL
eukprot:1122899-Alexandrium_andersonii.AAC.1